jgi:hypothetical protein
VTAPSQPAVASPESSRLAQAARVAGFALLVAGISAPQMKRRANRMRMWAFRERAALVARVDDPGALLRVSGALLLGVAASRRSQGTPAG